MEDVHTFRIFEHITLQAHMAHSSRNAERSAVQRQLSLNCVSGVEISVGVIIISLMEHLNNIELSIQNVSVVEHFRPSHHYTE